MLIFSIIYSGSPMPEESWNLPQKRFLQLACKYVHLIFVHLDPDLIFFQDRILIVGQCFSYLIPIPKKDNFKSFEKAFQTKKCIIYFK